MKTRNVPAVAVTSLLSLLSASCGPAEGTIAIDPSRTFQTISGWEATAEVGSLDLKDRDGFAHYRDALYDDAVDNLGINRLRLELRASAENTADHWRDFIGGQMDYEAWDVLRYQTVNDNDDPFDLDPGGFIWSELDYKTENIVLPIKRRLEARGEKLFLNLDYVAFTQLESFIHDDPEEYAEMVLATVRHLDTTHGLVPDAWEVILEPDNKTPFDGNLIGRIIVASAARLSAAGYDVPFIAPSTTCTDRAPKYFDEIAAVPGATDHILEVSYHRYCGGPSSDSVLEEIASRAKGIGAGTSMLEHIGSSVEALHDDLTIAQNTAWQQFTLAFVGTNDPGGKYYWIDETVPAKPRPVLASRSRYLRQYFHYVRRGAVRHAARSTNGAYAPTSFENANGAVVVVVQSKKAGTMTIEGLPPGAYGISYTTADETAAELPPRTIAAGERLETAIPAAGVLTVYDVDYRSGPSATASPDAKGPARSR